MVNYVEGMDKWNVLMDESNTKLVVVDFTASW